MTILSKHVYDSAWSPEAQAHYTQILKQYPYISPETQYTTSLPTPAGLSAREACQSAAEEALLADYRPLRAGFVEDYLDNGNEPVEGAIGFDLGNGIVQFSVDKSQLAELLKVVVGSNVNLDDDKAEQVEEDESPKKMELTSTRRKRYIKMKNHKRRKL